MVPNGSPNDPLIARLTETISELNSQLAAIREELVAQREASQAREEALIRQIEDLKKGSVRPTV